MLVAANLRERDKFRQYDRLEGLGESVPGKESSLLACFTGRLSRQSRWEPSGHRYAVLLSDLLMVQIIKVNSLCVLLDL